jgi:integrase
VSVYRRGGVWWIHVEVGGQSVRRSARTDKRAEAVELEAQVRTQLADAARRGLTGLPARRTLDDALATWLEGEAKALKSYPQIVNHARMLRPHIAGRWVDEAPAVAADYIAATVASLRPATINQRLAILRRIARLAYQWQWIADPVHSRVRLLPANNERHVYLTREQLEALAEAAGEAADALRLLAYSGLRASELYRATRHEGPQGTLLLLDARTKSGRPRVVPLPPAAAALPCPPTVDRYRLRLGFESARAAIGRPDLHLHDLRHTYASWLVQGGASPAQVRDLLGHAHLGVTSRYAHLSREDLWEAVAKIHSTGDSTKRKPKLRRVR